MQLYSDEKKTLSNFDLDKYLIPVWSGDIVYNESVMPPENADGITEPIDLAYDITEIFEVRSSDLSVLYKEDRDYTVENGKLCITRGGNIPIMKNADYYPDNKTENVKKRTGGRFLPFADQLYK